MKKINLIQTVMILLLVVLVTSCTTGRIYSSGGYIERRPGYDYYDNDYYYYGNPYPVIIDNSPYRARRYYNSRDYDNKYKERTYNHNNNTNNRNDRRYNEQKPKENQRNINNSKERILGRKN